MSDGSVAVAWNGLTRRTAPVAPTGAGKPLGMALDHTQAPVLQALTDYRGRAGDDRETTGELLAALKELWRAAHELPDAPRVAVPSPAEPRTAQVRLPRAAFFGPTEEVPVDRAAGRTTAETITP